SERADFYYQEAATLLQGDYGQDSWRLQVLTDLSKLPEYEETGSPYRYWQPEPARGTPVDGDGNPIFYHVPKGGWEGAASDGERWYWSIMQASELSPVEAQRARTMLAQFWQSQLGVQTMAGYGGSFSGPPEDGKTADARPFAVYT